MAAVNETLLDQFDKIRDGQSLFTAISKLDPGGT